MPEVGLVLSGGMAKGAYQVGVLRALQSYIAPEELACTSASSVGVLNAYAFLTGQLDYAERVWQTSGTERSRRLVTAMLRSTFLQNAIAEASSEDDRLPSSFYISLYSATQNRLSYVDLAKIDAARRTDYLRAAVSMPLYNRAVLLEGEKFFDGAMIDNIPVFPLVKRRLDYILCVYFDTAHYLFENKEFDRKVVRVTFPDTKIVSTSVFFQPDSIAYMLERGYEDGQELFARVFAKGTGNLPYIYEQIAQQNRQHNRLPRITGDFMVSNLNKVAKKLTRRKRIVD